MEEQMLTGEELTGKITLRLRPGKTLDEFCARNFENFNGDQHEAVAVRMLYGKELIITLYALDKVRQEGSTFDPNRIPVKKFKTTSVSVTDLLSFMDEVNFTLSAGNYPLEDMEVINK